MKKKPVRIFNRFVKREDARCYIMAYKPSPMPDNSFYTPIECGAVLHDRHFAIRDDMSSDNISSLNPAYAENTGIYWVWKNHPTDLKYIAICQYRRQLDLRQDVNLDNMFRDCDAMGAYLTCNEIRQGVATVREQFCVWHNPKWLDICEDIIKKDYSWFLPAWQQYVNEGDKIYASNCFVMKVVDFENYCSLLFGILEKFMNVYGGTVESLREKIEEEIASGEFEDKLSQGRGYLYQLFAPAFLAERILTAYIQSLGTVKRLNYNCIKEMFA